MEGAVYLEASGKQYVLRIPAVQDKGQSIFGGQTTESNEISLKAFERCPDAGAESQ